MSLTIVATPIGNLGDVTLRALEVLKSAEIIIGEEKREASTFLKRMGISSENLYLLNEHSREDDIRELLDFCRTKSVALITDCGTPGFCDPGADLVALCRKNNIPVTACPGASSLMNALMPCGARLDRFYFAGFLDRDSQKRKAQLQKLKSRGEPVVVMETPYRWNAFLKDCAVVDPQWKATLLLDATKPEERWFQDRVEKLAQTEIEGEGVLILS